MSKQTRRQFVKRSIGLGVLVAASPMTLIMAKQSQRKLNHAGIGVGGQGWHDMNTLAAHSDLNVVAICDVDNNSLNRAASKYPKARKYHDWRELLDKEKDNIDSCHVTVPDHMHAPISMSAMHLGKHVYCQKPLTHDIHEARCLTQVAQQNKIVTQMGIQGHAGIGNRMAVKMLKDIAIGPIKAVHVWTDRPLNWWPQNVDRPKRVDPVPASMKWDLWLGTAPQRPYVRGVYHSFKWRGWLDFGTGAIGDIACHAMDPLFAGLDLTAPTLIWSDGPKPNNETYPLWSIIHYQFPATKYTDQSGVKVSWYDGGKHPPDELKVKYGIKNWQKNGKLFIGEKGALFLVDGPQLLPREKFRSYPRPKLKPYNHYHQWIDACLGKTSTTGASFKFSGPLTESALLGNVALRFGQKKIQWDSTTMSFPNMPDANQYVKRTYRKSWEVQGL